MLETIEYSKIRGEPGQGRGLLGKSAVNNFDTMIPVYADAKTFTNPVLRVNWNLGNVCNYSCSYCAKSCHDGTWPWPEAGAAVNAVRHLDQIYKNPPYAKNKILFELLGGEVTFWKDFELLLDEIHRTGNLCLLVTNGSRPLEWWKEHGAKFSHITLSFHPEKADYRHVTEVSNILAEAGVSVAILCLMYPARWDYLMESYSHFTEHSKAVSICLQTLTLLGDSAAAPATDPSHRMHWPYSQVETDWLRSHPDHYNEATLNKLKARDASGQFSKWLSGKSFLYQNAHADAGRAVEPSVLSSGGLNSWTGWDCYVGIDTLFLEQNGDIRRDAMCYATKPLGNWKNDDLYAVDWPVNPVRCPKSSCFCAHDFLARRRLPELNP